MKSRERHEERQTAREPHMGRRGREREEQLKRERRREKQKEEGG